MSYAYVNFDAQFDLSRNAGRLPVGVVMFGVMPKIDSDNCFTATPEEFVVPKKLSLKRVALCFSYLKDAGVIVPVGIGRWMINPMYACTSEGSSGGESPDDKTLDRLIELFEFHKSKHLNREKPCTSKKPQ